MKKYLVYSLLPLLISSCSITEYKKADLSNYAGLDGYLDKEILPGVYIVEVTQRGGYQFGFDNEDFLNTLTIYWERRAAELCPNGYEGNSSPILAINAQIEKFYCTARFCQGYPVISGQVECKSSEHVTNIGSG